MTRHVRTVLWRAMLAASGLVMGGIALAAHPAAGKYRCYQPPAYTVIAWFELGEGQARINGDDPVPFRFATASARLDWTTEALAPYRHGRYFPPGTPGGDAERTTIVLMPRPDTRPERPGWAKLPRCYLTTH